MKSKAQGWYDERSLIKQWARWLLGVEVSGLYTEDFEFCVRVKDNAAVKHVTMSNQFPNLLPAVALEYLEKQGSSLSVSGVDTTLQKIFCSPVYMQTAKYERGMHRGNACTWFRVAIRRVESIDDDLLQYYVQESYFAVDREGHYRLGPAGEIGPLVSVKLPYPALQLVALSKLEYSHDFYRAFALRMNAFEQAFTEQECDTGCYRVKFGMSGSIEKMERFGPALDDLSWDRDTSADQCVASRKTLRVDLLE